MRGQIRKAPKTASLIAILREFFNLVLFIHFLPTIIAIAIFNFTSNCFFEPPPE